MHGKTFSSTDRHVVCGAGGFIGGHLVKELLQTGAFVRGIDIKDPADWYQRFESVEEQRLDLRHPEACAAACSGITHVWNLACDMGGIGFTETQKAACMLSVLINTHLLESARLAGVQRYFFSSTACVYPVDLQRGAVDRPLREEDAYPANPDDGYGWEKLFSERMCRHYREDHGVETRVARLHNVYGPNGTWRGGREKAPAALCRKVAEAKINGDRDIQIWGNGRQRRSYMFIDDCICGILDIMGHDYASPVNLGSAQSVMVDELLDCIETVSDCRTTRTYDMSQPQGVASRNSENSLFEEQYGWQPSTSLDQGIANLYPWIESQVMQNAGVSATKSRSD